MKSMAREAERIHNPYVRALAGAVEEAIEVFELSDPDGDHLDIEAPEDAAVAQLCVRYGYGAVISSAVRVPEEIRGYALERPRLPTTNDTVRNELGAM